MKKLLALVLALVMVLGLSVTANAATFSDADSITYKEAVDVMSAIGVLDGMDGKFNPAGTLTREQGAKIITYMLLGKTAADSLNTTSAPFDDVAADRWSAGSIAYCVTEGIIGGVGGNKFNPEGQLTGHAFAKMLLCALGYKAEFEGYVGSEWAINVAKGVIKAGLDSDLDITLSNPVTREQAAQMALNTEVADIVDYDNAGTTVTVGGATISTAASKAAAQPNTNYEYRTGMGTVAATGNTAGNNVNMQFCEKYAPKLKLDKTGVDSFGRDAHRWFLSSGKNDTAFTTGIDTSITKLADKADYTIKVTGNTKTLDALIDTVSTSIELAVTSATPTAAAGAATEALTDITHVYINGAKATSVVTSAAQINDSNAAAATANAGVITAMGSYKPVRGDVIELFMNDNGKTIDKVAILRYTGDVVMQNPDSNVSTTDKNNNVKYYTSFKYAVPTKDKDVPGFDAATYVKDTPVALAINSDDNSIVDSYVMTAVSGAITAASQNSDNTRVYTVDGAKYTMSANGVDTAINGTVDFKNGNYSLYLNKDGDYVLFTKINTADVALDDVVFVRSTYYRASASFGASTSYKYYAQTVTLDGVVGEVEISSAAYNGLIKTTAWTPALGTYLADANTNSNVDNGTDTYTAAAVSAKLFAATGTITGPAVNDAATIAADAVVTGGAPVVSGATIDTSKTFYFYDPTQVLDPGHLYSFDSVSGETYKVATAYNPTSGSYRVGTFNQTAAVKLTDSTIGAYKVNADTQYVLVNGANATIKVKAATGGINMATFNSSANEDIAIYTTDSNNNKIAKYMVLITTDNTQTAVADTTNLLYYPNTISATAVAKGYNWELYDLEGNKVTVYTKSGTAASAGLTTANRFYVPSVDSDGYYTFAIASTPVDFDDSTSLITNGYCYDNNYAGLYEGKISATGGSYPWADVKAENAIVVDLRAAGDKEGSVYSADITSVNALQAAYQRGAIKFDAFATKADGIQIIYVQSLTGYTLTKSSGTNYATFYSNAAASNAITTAVAGQTVYMVTTGSVADTDIDVLGYTDFYNVTDDTSTVASFTAGKVYSFTMPYSSVIENAGG